MLQRAIPGISPFLKMIAHMTAPPGGLYYRDQTFAGPLTIHRQVGALLFGWGFHLLDTWFVGPVTLWRKIAVGWDRWVSLPPTCPFSILLLGGIKMRRPLLFYGMWSVVRITNLSLSIYGGRPYYSKAPTTYQPRGPGGPLLYRGHWGIRT